MEREIAIISCIEKELDEKFNAEDKSKLWEKFYIKKQIEKREKGLPFTLSDHVRAMVYSLLSSFNEWNKIESNKDEIDKIFCNFDIHRLLHKLKEKSDFFEKELKSIKCGTQSMRRQIAVLPGNIELLQKIQKKGKGDIDAFYQVQISTNASGEHPYKELIKMLSTKNSEYKLKQMGIALVAEYLRNVGYGISKPDRHIVRLLGPNGLQEHSYENDASDTARWKAFEIIRNYAMKTNKSEAYIDYLFWAYCANKYGEICTKKAPKCAACKIKDYCKKEMTG